MEKRTRGGARRTAFAFVAAAGLVLGTAGPGAAEDASPVVGSWIVKVTVEGAPPLVLPNLVTFSADGTVAVAAPAVLPELPGSDDEDHFSAGQGAWTARGTNGADVTFAFLVSGEDGKLASINTVHGSIEVDPANKVYIGQFKLDITGADGAAKGNDSGTWAAKRIEAGGEGPLTMP